MIKRQKRYTHILYTFFSYSLLFVRNQTEVKEKLPATKATGNQETKGKLEQDNLSAALPLSSKRRNEKEKRAKNDQTFLKFKARIGNFYVF